MAVGILGQQAPAAATWVELTYAGILGSTSAITGSSLTMCNRGDSVAKVRVAVIPLGGSVEPTDANYLYYDLPIDGHDTFISTIGLTLGAGTGDSVQVYSDTGQVTFHLYGDGL